MQHTGGTALVSALLCSCKGSTFLGRQAESHCPSNMGGHSRIRQARCQLDVTPLLPLSTSHGTSS